MLNLTDNSLLSIRKPMMKTRKIGRCQGLEVFGRHVVAMHNNNMIYFNRFPFKNR